MGLLEDPAAQFYRTIEILDCPFHLNAIRTLEDRPHQWLGKPMVGGRLPVKRVFAMSRLPDWFEGLQ